MPGCRVTEMPEFCVVGSNKSPKASESGSNKSPDTYESCGSGSNKSPGSYESGGSGGNKSPDSHESCGSGSNKSPGSYESGGSGGNKSPGSHESCGSGGNKSCVLSIDESLCEKRRGSFFDMIQIFKKRDSMSDFKVKIHKDVISCHKIVLAARCEYFFNLFNNRVIKERQPCSMDFGVQMQVGAVKDVIDYCYSGKLQVTMDEAEHVLKVIDYFEIPHLKPLLDSLIESHLTSDNCIKWYLLSEKYAMPKVEEKAAEIMSVDFARAVKAPEFFRFEYETLTRYLLRDDVERSAAVVAAASWAMHDVKRRQVKFYKIVGVLDLKRCSSSAIKHVLTEYGSTLLSPDKKHAFIGALLDRVPSWQGATKGAGYDIIILGGEHSGEINSRVWMLNVKSGVCLEKTRCPTKHAKLYLPAVATTSKGAVLVGGGSAYTADYSTFFGPSCTCSVYIKADDMWAYSPDLEQPVVAASAVCSENDTVYVVASRAHGNDTVMYCLNLKSLKWSSMLPCMKDPLACCVLQRIYAIATSISSADEDSESGLPVQCYDITASTWSYLANVPPQVSTLRGARAASLGQRVYVVGGVEHVCLSYTIYSDVWCVLTPPVHRHQYAAVMVLKGRIILCGGKGEKTESDVIEMYNTATDTWNVLPVKLPMALYNHAIIPAEH